MPIEALLPEGCVPRRGPPPVSDRRAFVSGWIARCPNGIAGGEIRIEGLEATRTDVLVRYLLAPGGAVKSHRLTPDAPAFVPPLPRGPAALLLD